MEYFDMLLKVKKVNIDNKILKYYKSVGAITDITSGKQQGNPIILNLIYFFLFFYFLN